MSTIPQFTNILNNNASNARYYRSSDTAIVCPCRTPEGYRDAELHLAFGKYGPVGVVKAAGAILKGTNVAYAFVAESEDGVAISPPVMVQALTDSVNDFQVQFTLNPPTDVLGLYGGTWEI